MHSNSREFSANMSIGADSFFSSSWGALEVARPFPMTACVRVQNMTALIILFFSRNKERLRETLAKRILTLKPIKDLIKLNWETKARQRDSDREREREGSRLKTLPL